MLLLSHVYPIPYVRIFFQLKFETFHSVFELNCDYFHVYFILIYIFNAIELRISGVRKWRVVGHCDVISLLEAVSHCGLIKG